MPKAATTVEEFLDFNHLDDCLKIRAAYHVNDVIRKLESSNAKKKVKMNDLFAQDLIAAVRAHMIYMSFLIYRREIEKI